MIYSNFKGAIFFLLIIVHLPAYSQQNIHTWIETTVKDFSANQLNNVIVKNDSG